MKYRRLTIKIDKTEYILIFSCYIIFNLNIFRLFVKKLRFLFDTINQWSYFLIVFFIAIVYNNEIFATSGNPRI